MAKSRRQRGVLLAPAGFRRLQAARQTLETQQNFGEPFTFEQLSELANLDVHTVKRALSTTQRVDRRTLAQLFAAFDLELGPSDFATPSRPRRQDWGGAVSAPYFYGRQQELATLTQWIGADRCRIVTIYGVAGIGKSTLALEAARQWQDRFEGFIWRSLQDPTDPKKLIEEIVAFLDPDLEVGADASDWQLLSYLLQGLQQQRCLLIFDNVEALFRGGARAGEYCPGYEVYGEIFRRLGEAEHQSCLLLTTREKPREIAFLEGDASPVRSLRLGGLRESEEVELLGVRGLKASPEDCARLAEQYGGNPLALTLVASTIRDVFDGDVAGFMAQKSSVYGDLRDLLEGQFDRLSAAERDILYWLAIDREPTSLAQLRQDAIARSERPLLETLESLLRRAVLTRSAARFSCHPVILEYAVERLLDEAYQELVTGQLQCLHTHALYKAQTKDYLREAQRRVLLQPLLAKLCDRWESQHQVVGVLTKKLNDLQTAAAPPSYAPGNLVNLLREFEVNFSGWNFSGLTLWQADFQNALLQGADFRRTDLRSARFTQYLGSIRDIAFSPDGRFFATGDTNGELYIYRADAGRQMARIGHRGWLWSITYSPNGKMLASGGEDSEIELWDAESGENLTTLCGHEAGVRTMNFTPDGTHLISGSEDGTVRVWNLDSDRCTQILIDGYRPVVALAIGADGKTLASSDGREIHLWQLPSGKCLATFNDCTGPIRALAFCPQSQQLAGGGDDCSIHLWNFTPEAGQPVEHQRLQGHQMGVSSLSFSPDGSRLASGSDDCTIRLWNLTSNYCERALSSHQIGVSAIAFSPDNKTIASGSLDCTIQLWDASSGRALRSHQGNGNGSQAIAFSPDSRMLAVCRQQFADLWDISGQQRCRQLQAGHPRLTALAYSPDGRYVVAGCLDSSIKVWDARGGASLPHLQGHHYRTLSVAFSPDGQILASGSEDRRIVLWDWERREQMCEYEGHDHRVWSLAFGPDGQTLASASHDGTVRLWEVATGKCLWIGAEHKDWVWSVAFSPDGESIASSSSDGSLKIWDRVTGTCRRTLIEGAYTFSVAYSRPDGRILASGHSDGSIRLWDPASGRRLAALTGQTRSIWALAISPDGKTLAGTSSDETIALWNLEAIDLDGIAEDAQPQILRSPRPYEGMKIAAVTGLTSAKFENLKSLGAIAEPTEPASDAAG